MLLAGHRRGTVGADKNADVRRVVHTLRAQGAGGELRRVERLICCQL